MSRRQKDGGGVSVEEVRAVALELPGVTEKTSYGTGAFRVGGKLFLRFHQDGEALVLRADAETRERCIARRPDVYFMTDHYEGRDWVLARRHVIDPAELQAAVEQAWRLRAPARRIAERDRKS